MGYSCTAKAGFVREAIEALIANKLGPGKPSNATLDGGFWEIGRENADGSITGKVWKPWGTAGHVVPRGSFKIDSEGKIVRFPGLPLVFRQTAEAIGANQYSATYGGAQVARYDGAGNVIGVSPVPAPVV